MGVPGRRTEHLVEKTSPKTVSLDALTVQLLEVLGDGNASLGIRRAARFAYDCYQMGRWVSPDKRNAPPGAPVAGALPPAKSAAPRGAPPR